MRYTHCMTSFTVDKNPTVRLRDVAAKADLSVSAVSMALAGHPNISDQTRRRVRQISRDLGYRPKGSAGRNASGQDLNQLRAKRLGLLFVGSEIQQMDTVHQLSVIAARVGARLEISAVESTDPRDAEAVVAEFSNGLDALVLTGHINNDLLHQIELSKIPCVIFGNTLLESEPRPYGHIVGSNAPEMARIAVHRLWERGHDRIGFVAEDMPPGLWINGWLNGYQLAHLQKCKTMDPAWVQISGHAGSGADHAVRVFSNLEHVPTAYLIPEPRVADSFIRGMKDVGLIVHPRSVFLGKHPTRAKVSGLESAPRIHNNDVLLAELLMDTVLRSIEGELRRPIDLYASPILHDA